jgi:hypothetical protein
MGQFRIITIEIQDTVGRLGAAVTHIGKAVFSFACLKNKFRTMLPTVSAKGTILAFCSALSVLANIPYRAQSDFFASVTKFSAVGKELSVQQ